MNWKDISIKKYYEIRDLLSVQDEYTALNLIDCVYGVDANNIKLTELSKYSLDFLKEPIGECEIPKNLKLNGHEYDVDFKLTDVSAAQFIDFQNHIKGEDTKYEDILSVFITPKGCKYNENYDIEEVKADLLELSIVEATAISRFFFLQFRLFAIIFQHYLTKSLKKMKLPKEEKEKVLENLERLDFQALESYLTY